MHAFIVFMLVILGVYTPLNAKKKYNYKLSIAAIFKNEAPYLREWIEFHLAVGVQHFYLYNNESSDNYLEVLDPYIEKDIVEITDWVTYPGEHFVLQCQPRAYVHALNKARGESKWVAFIDTDEFLFPLRENNLRKCLETRYKDYAGVVVYWQTYGTSNVVLGPYELMIERLTLKAPMKSEYNQWYKSIVKPALVTHCDNPHYFHFVAGETYLNENGDYVKPGVEGITVNHLRINHYTFRDLYFLNNVKIPRFKKAWNVTSECLNEMDKDLCIEEDKSIFRFIPKLKRQMSFY